jgi:hypothetical protein
MVLLVLVMGVRGTFVNVDDLPTQLDIDHGRCMRCQR